MPEKNGIPNRADILQRNTCTMLVLFHIYAITFQDNRFHVPKPTLLGTVLKKCVSPYFSYLCIWKY